MSLLFVTSWDDGRESDARLAKLLDKYGLKGTFYITTCKTAELHPLSGGRKSEYGLADRGERISDSEIRKISKNHEIGCHTHTHPLLTELTGKEMENEIMKSKKTLEKITGRRVVSFSYPYGKYSGSTIPALKELGFSNARTVGRFNIYLPDNAFEICPTIDAFPRNIPPGPNFIKDFRRNAKASTSEVMLMLAGKPNWLRFAKILFDIAYKRGGVFHLYGHSWMLNKFKMWNDLEKFFKYVSSYDIEPVTVSEMVKKCK